MTSTREVVITGLGVVSPIGIGRAEFVDSLRTGRSGVARIEQYAPDALAVPYGAELKGFEPKQYVKPRKSLKVMCREIQAGVAAAGLAVEDAQLSTDELDAERFGVIFGSPMLYSEPHELQSLFAACSPNGTFDYSAYGVQFPKQMQPLWMLKYLPNMTASHIGIAHNARGANNSVVLGDVSSLLAMMEAVTVIERGCCDVALTGGSGNRLSLTGVVYRGDSNLSHAQDPQRASRPFDLRRDGMVIGEGAGALVLEERQHAEQRGAQILARVTGHASTHSGANQTQGMSAAIERSIRRCLEKAGESRVGQVNAHGLSDRGHDEAEARAICNVLGDVPVTAPKSYFGNVGAASGALELAASLCLPDTVLPTLNFEQADPTCPVRVSNQMQSPERSTILKLNQAGTGQAVALLVDTEV